MKIKQINYYGFDHDKIRKKFEGDLEYLNSFEVQGKKDFVTVAVYKNHKPNRERGHKDYTLLTNEYIAGMDKEEINKYRFQTGLHCYNCDEVIYSPNRHSLVTCSCSYYFIDGGKSYLRMGSGTDFPTDNKGYKLVEIDLIENKVLK